MTRAVLEGVAFGLADNLALMRSVGISGVKEVRVAGGGAKSALWRGILADILGVDLVTVDAPEGAAFGAALLAAVGVGAWPSVEDACDAAVELGGVTSPDTEKTLLYDPVYARFRQAFPVLQSLYR